MGAVDEIYNLINLFEKESDCIEYTEDDSNYHVCFKAKVSVFKKILTASLIEEVNRSKEFMRITFKYDESAFTLDDFKTYHLPNKTCKLNLTILKKKIIISSIQYEIYFNLNELCDNILKDKTNIFSNSDKKKIIFLPIQNEYWNNYIYLIPIENLKTINLLDRDLKISYHNKKQQRMIQELFNKNIDNPFIYYLDNFNESKKFRDIMNYKLFINTMELLSNKEENNLLFFYGERNLELKKEFFIVRNPKNILELLEFNLDLDKFNDKIVITREVITIYITDIHGIENIDQLIDKILNTLDLYFRAYVKKQLDHFFDRRKDIIDEAYNAARASTNQSDKVITSINLTLLGLLSAILTGLLSYSTGSKRFLTLVISSHLIYFIFSSVINIRNGYQRKKDINELFDGYSNEFSVLDKDEIDDIKLNFLIPALNRLDNSLKLFKWISIIMTIVVICCLIYIIFYYNPIPRESHIIFL